MNKRINCRQKEGNCKATERTSASEGLSPCVHKIGKNNVGSHYCEYYDFTCSMISIEHYYSNNVMGHANGNSDTNWYYNTD